MTVAIINIFFLPLKLEKDVIAVPVAGRTAEENKQTVPMKEEINIDIEIKIKIKILEMNIIAVVVRARFIAKIMMVIQFL